MDQRDPSYLGKGPVGKLLFQLALPAITAQVINLLYNLVDRMYIGHIPNVGAQALTGMGVCMPVIMSIAAFAALVAMGAAPRASILLGRQDKEGAEKILGGAVFTLTVVALSLTALFLVGGRAILMLFGASDNTIGYALDYMRIYVLGTFFVQMTLGMNAFISAQGYAKTSMHTVMLGAILNIVLDPVFIFGFHMGVRGAALATILSQAASCIWVLHFLTGKRSFLRIRRANIRFERRVMMPCLALGLAPFIMQFTEAVLAICFNSSLKLYGGDIAVGAMTILTSVMQFSMLPLQGLTQGAQPLISYNFGARSIDRVKKAFKLQLFACLSYSTLLWAGAMFAPRMFASIFSSDPTLIEFTVWALRIYMCVGLIFGAQVACQQTFIALGNAKTSLFLALLRKVLLLIPLIYILPHFFEDKVFAVFLAEPVADFIAVSVTCCMFFTSFRKLCRKMEQENASGVQPARDD